MMFTRFFCIASAIASSVVALPADLEPRAFQCVDGVFIIAARGTDNNSLNPNQTDPNFGAIGNLATIANAVINKAGQGSFLQALPYPASPIPFYELSMAAGIDAAQSMIMDYVNQCKATVNPRIMLLGYSQGAQVMTAALIGGEGRPNLDAFKQFIVGGALFASPSFVAGFEPIDAGNSTTSGIEARDQADETYFNNNYGNKVRDYCQAGDEFCATGLGLDNNKIHLAEVETYQADATNFLLGLV